MLIIAQIVHYLIQLLVLVVIVQVILSYFMDPHAPVRFYLDRVVQPMLEPIRRIVPLVGNLDFSPVVLIILLQIVDAVLTNVLRSISF